MATRPINNRQVNLTQRRPQAPAVNPTYNQQYNMPLPQQQFNVSTEARQQAIGSYPEIGRSMQSFDYRPTPDPTFNPQYNVQLPPQQMAYQQQQQPRQAVLPPGVSRNSREGIMMRRAARDARRLPGAEGVGILSAPPRYMKPVGV